MGAQALHGDNVCTQWEWVGQTGRQRSMEVCGCVGTQDKGQQQTGAGGCVEWWRIGWRLFLVLLVVERSVEGGGHGEVC